MLSAEEIKRFEKWGRYKDFDGDGITYRTLPGNQNPSAAYLSRGTGHNEYGAYSERPSDWKANLDRLTLKHETARTLVPGPELDEVEGARIGIIAYGSADPAVREARDRLRARGVATSYLRLRALPLEATTRAFMEKYDRVYVVELNQDGQMRQLVQLHAPELAAKVRPAQHLRRPAAERAVCHRDDYGARTLIGPLSVVRCPWFWATDGNGEFEGLPLKSLSTTDRVN